MNIGPLKTRAKFMKKTVGKDPTYGTSIDVWVLHAVRWVGIQDQLPTRSERISNDMIVTQQSTRMRTRHCTDLDSAMRVVINRLSSPTTYEVISGPAELGDKDGLEFMIEKVSTQNNV